MYCSPRHARRLIVICGIAWLGSAAPRADARTRFVREGGAGRRDGSSWADAYADVQQALGAAAAGDAIWIAAGTYRPDGGTGDRAAAFSLRPGMALVGGFAGDEDPATFELADRNLARYRTILSGDLLGNDSVDSTTRTDNSYQIVRVVGQKLNPARLDGLTIEASQSNALEPYQTGGLFVQDSSLRVGDCVLREHRAAYYGAAIVADRSEYVLERCDLISNCTESQGGGILNSDSHGTLLDCRITGNSAPVGGGVYLTNGSLRVVGCLFLGNSAQHGGGVFAEYGSLIAGNCRFLGNEANDWEGHGAGGFGGAVYAGEAFLGMANCLVANNRAGRRGGGIWVQGPMPADLSHCTIVCNRIQLPGYSAGIDTWHTHNVVDLALRDCILWGNRAGLSGGESAQVNSMFKIESCCIEGWTGALGDAASTGEDPRFLDLRGMDGRLETLDDDAFLAGGSPCRDQVAPSRLVADSADVDSDGDTTEPLPLDIDGRRRVIAGAADWGAFEQSLVIFPGQGEIDEGRAAIAAYVALPEPPEAPLELVAAIVGDPDLQITEPPSLRFDASDYDLPRPVFVSAQPDTDMANGWARLRLAGAPDGPVELRIEERDDDAPAALLVNHAAAPGGDGLSWATAFQGVQAAIDAAAAFGGAVREVWIAAGRYLPTYGAQPEDSRSASFRLVDGISLYGGFAGTEAVREARDPAAHETILSGDFADANASVTVTASLVDPSTVLDGFTIVGGNPEEPADGHGDGLVVEGPLQVVNCRFVECGHAARVISGLPAFRLCAFTGSYRRAVRVSCADALLAECRFVRNRADGALHVEQGSARLFNCTLLANAGAVGGGVQIGIDGILHAANSIFNANESLGYNATGGAIHGLRGWELVLTNCTLVHNRAPSSPSAVQTSLFERPQIYDNSIFWGNRLSVASAVPRQAAVADAGGGTTPYHHCTVEGWTGALGGEGNDGANPLFIDADGLDGIAGTEDDDLRLSPGSPCIDTGDAGRLRADAADLDEDGQTEEPVPWDIEGWPRVLGAELDRGVAEQAWQGISTAIAVPEGGTTSLELSLKFEPPQPIRVLTSIAGEDLDFAVIGGADLVFGPETGAGPLTVLLTAALDADYVNGHALLRIEVAGKAPLLLDLRERETNAPRAFLVSAGAAPGGDGITWATALRDVQDALDAAAATAGGVPDVWVAAGSYRPSRLVDPQDPRSATFALAPGVRLLGGFRPGATEPSARAPMDAPTVLSADLAGNDRWGAKPTHASRADNCLHIVTADLGEGAALLDGFALRGATPKASISSPSSGGGVLALSGDLTVANCTFVGNAATEGSAVYAYKARLTLVNCAFSGNETSAVIAARGSSCRMVQCTLALNAGSTQSPVVRLWCEPFEITNCILWRNWTSSSVPAQYRQIAVDPGIAGTIAHCCIEGWTSAYGGTDITTADPLLHDPDGVDDMRGTLDDDLRLGPGSPCIDQGANAALPRDEWDIDDDGDADEPFPVDLVRAPRALDDPATPDRPGAQAPVVDLGAFEFEGPPLVPVTILRVASGAAPGGDGTSWARAYTGLQDALAAATRSGWGPKEIWVASGTYRPDRGTGQADMSFELYSGLGLYGGFAGDEETREGRQPQTHRTVLSGDLLGNDGLNFSGYEENSIQVVRILPGANPETRLDGFEITGGNARVAGGYGYGAGILIESGAAPVLRDLDIAYNRASGYGGGIYADGSATALERCRFRGNQAVTGSGGALYCREQAEPFVVRECEFRSNTGPYGGAIYASNRVLDLRNCLFVKNTATVGAAVHLNSYLGLTMHNCTLIENRSAVPWSPRPPISGEAALLTNCVLRGNRVPVTLWQSSSWWDLFSGVIEVVLEHSCVDDAIPQAHWGAGTFSADPRFVAAAAGDYHLRPDSPCIDAGNPQSAYAREPEPNGNRVDLGRYGNTEEATSRGPWYVEACALLGRTATPEGASEYELGIFVRNAGDPLLAGAAAELIGAPAGVEIVAGRIELPPIAPGSGAFGLNPLRVRVAAPGPRYPIVLTWRVGTDGAWLERAGLWEVPWGNILELR